MGVPKTTPVEVFKLRPAGRVPEVTAYVTGAVRSAGVYEVVGVMAVLMVPDTVWVAGVMAAAACAGSAPPTIPPRSSAGSTVSPTSIRVRSRMTHLPARGSLNTAMPSLGS